MDAMDCPADGSTDCGHVRSTDGRHVRGNRIGGPRPRAFVACPRGAVLSRRPGARGQAGLNAAIDRTSGYGLDMQCPECGFALDAPLGISTEIVGAVGEWVQPRLGQTANLRPDPATWSVVEYLCHLRDAVEFYRLRIEAIVTSREPPQLTPWDPDQAAVDGRYSTSDPRAAYEQAIQAGELLRSHLESMADAQVSKTGIGVDGGSRGVPELAARAAHEVVHHGLDIARVGTRSSARNV